MSAMVPADGGTIAEAASGAISTVVDHITEKGDAASALAGAVVGGGLVLLNALGPRALNVVPLTMGILGVGAALF